MTSKFVFRMCNFMSLLKYLTVHIDSRNRRIYVVLDRM